MRSSEAFKHVGIFLTVLIITTIIFTLANNYSWFMPYNMASIVKFTILGLSVVTVFYGAICCLLLNEDLYMPIIANCIILGVIALFINFVLTSKIFHYEKYRSLAGEIKTEEFNEDISVVDISKLPVISTEVAKKIADKKLGEMTSIGSQMTVGELNMQIVNDTLYYVAPLEYTGFFKWKNNDGIIPGYILVNAQKDNEATLVNELNGNPIKIKYSMKNYFSGNIKRKSFKEKKSMYLDDYTFEIDEEGNPYWVISILEKTIFTTGDKAVGVLTINAQTGETKEYNIADAPKWIDRIQPLDIVDKNLNNWGELVHGVFNFSQKDAIKTTEGYNIIYNNGEGYYYTGLTSVGSDESLIGFILTNTRTGESTMYKVSGAIESSAMESAKGKVQERNLEATFPVLINIQNKPTYFMLMLDNAGLVKGYSFVNVENYNLVGFGENLQDAFSNYAKLLGTETITLSNNSEKETLEGIIDRIGINMKENQLYYTVVLKENKNIFIVPDNLLDVTVSKIGDTVSIEYVKNADNIIISNFKNKSLVQE